MESLVWEEKPRLIDKRISHIVVINDAFLYPLRQRNVCSHHLAA